MFPARLKQQAGTVFPHDPRWLYFFVYGFTGKEAAKWKEAYINAFNRLEQAACPPLSASGQEARFEPRLFQGQTVLVAEVDGQPWFCAGTLSTALGLHRSDRVVRSLTERHKCKVLRGSREVWMVDATGARRAADYCRNGLAGAYRQWLEQLLAEPAGADGARAWPGERDALQALPAAIEQVLGHTLLGTRFLMYFDFTGEMRIQAIDPGTTLLSRDNLARFIADPEGAPSSTLPDILEAVSRRMKPSAGCRP